MFNSFSALQFPVLESLWNITGTHIGGGRKDSASDSYAQGSMIPGANYSAQDDHSGVQVAGM
eukprot:CAMPEP_0172151084 /NCGR_PEP_ID=MMETSP1050-20130122/22_1 /TAXON_ID=233186 /ORGANISM="Cryptomonas curvata, Strain CCAP979/52" /LENGTH=61 /DNA_ID=CAMNT_0012819129 /DNA_START=236 /DNA_END=421 /DNA_ORIENTATION=-